MRPPEQINNLAYQVINREYKCFNDIVKRISPRVPIVNNLRSSAENAPRHTKPREHTPQEGPHRHIIVYNIREPKFISLERVIII